jgi:hypothetical protein
LAGVSHSSSPVELWREATSLGVHDIIVACYLAISEIYSLSNLIRTIMTEDKKGVLVRLPQKLHQDLLREASQESVKRGETVSVPRLILEILQARAKAKK